MLKEPNPLNDVSKFHQTFQHPIQPEPIIPAEKRSTLRVSLLQEELNELKDAIADNDLVEIADALCDIQYVLSGAILEFGLAGKFKDLFEEVQRSNMSKACINMAEAEATRAHYIAKDGTESYIKELNGKFLVFRSSDDKTLKSVNFSPANLKQFL